MKIKTLLSKALRCKSQADADNLLGTLTDVFSAHRLVSHLETANNEAYMEEAGPLVRFELNRVISEHYITMVRPEIRDGKLVVVVVTNHMKDGLGMSSQDWEVVDEMEVVIEPTEDQTVAQVVRQAVDCALADHQELIERVGVPPAIAKKTARQSW